MLEGLARVWVAAAQMCKVSLVHACWSHRERLGSLSIRHLPVPWEGDSFLEHEAILHLAWNSMKPLAASASAGCIAKHHIYLISELIFLFYIVVGTH